MIRKYILGSTLAIMFLSGSILADGGHGTHTPGTIGAIGNNGASIGGNGRDVLIGGLGSDYLAVAANLMVAGVQYLIRVA